LFFLSKREHTIFSRDWSSDVCSSDLIEVDGRTVSVPGYRVPDGAQLVWVGRPPRFVSRGGEKLVHALEVFGIGVDGLTCLDVGASTGGFTDCLLQRGARRVYAVDVGYGQLAWTLRNDPRVVSRERTNVRNLTRADFPERFDLVVIDASFISLRLVLPSVLRVVDPGCRIVALVKPQFEVGKGRVGKGGV